MDNQQQSRDALVAEVVRRYLSGQSIRAVAAGIQRSYGLVQRILKQSGVTARAPGRTSQVTNRPDGPEPDAATSPHPGADAKVPKKAKKKAEKKMTKKDKHKHADKAKKAKKAKKTTSKKGKKTTSKKGKKK